MDAPARILHPLLLAGLVLAAICGYLLGGHRVASSAPPQDPPSAARVVSNSGLLLEYPIGWERAAVPEVIPGLSLSEAVTVTPRGGGGGSGLLSGRVTPGNGSTLPTSFLAGLRTRPHAEVVDLLATQAYRYSHLEPAGYGKSFDLYAIPSLGGSTSLMACFTPQRLTPASQQCERIVAGVALTGPAGPSLTPEPTYATALSRLVTTLDAERLRARAKMSRTGSVSSVGETAASLAARFSAAAGGLATLEPPGLIAPAQAALAATLRGAGAAYSALAAAAAGEEVTAYDNARTAVGAAETRVDRALESFVLFGYGE